MNAYSVIPGGQQGRRGLGQVYHHAAAHTSATTVNSTDIEREVASRGYVVQTVIHHAPVVHEVPAAPTLTKSMAVKIAVDMGIQQIGLSRTSTHPYRCPSGTCSISQTYYNTLISWCVSVANGLLSGLYPVPSWAQTMIHSGALSGLGRGGHLSGWIQDNPWVIESVGDVVNNYGEYLTAKNVEEAIKDVEKNTRGSLSKDDIPALVAALTQGGYIPQNKQAIAAEGAMAATPSWMVPAMIAGAVLLVVMLMGRK